MSTQDRVVLVGGGGDGRWKESEAEAKAEAEGRDVEITVFSRDRKARFIYLMEWS